MKGKTRKLSGDIQEGEHRLNVTKQKELEDQQALINGVIHILNRPNDIDKIVKNILTILKESTGIECIGIRLKEGEDFPYYETEGFPPHFLETEKSLCARNESGEIIRDQQGRACLEGMCGRIILGKTDTQLSCFTNGGSFWTNRLSLLPGSIKSKYREFLTRDRCRKEGYESVAIIPLKSGEEIIGLVQLNDKRPNRFAPGKIKFFEEMGATIGIALKRLGSAERIRLDEARFESLFKISQYKAESIQDLLDYALHEAISLTGSKIGYIYFYDNAKKEFTLNSWSRDVMEECKIKEIQTTYHLDNTGIWGEPVRQAKPVILNDFSSPNPLKKGYPEGHASLCKYLSIPVFSADRIVAVVGVANKNSDYDQSDVRQLTLLMDSVWKIVEHEKAQKALRKSEDKYRTIIENSGEGIFQTTPDGRFLTLNQAFADMLGYSSPEEVTEKITNIPSQIYVEAERRRELLDLLEKNGSVKGFEAEFYRKDGAKFWLSINMHVIRDTQGNILCYQGIVADITVQKKAENERRQSLDRLRKALGATVRAIASIVEARDPYTSGHQKRVAHLARAISQQMGLDINTVEGLRMAAIIHDIGKIAIPAEILSKPTKLSSAEYELIKDHCKAAYDMLKGIEFPWPVAEIILQHHERIDGSGYPNGLSGKDILIEARILAVADVVEAIASHRPYRPALGVQKALDEIERNKGVLYDADVVDACQKLLTADEYRLE